MGPEVCFWPMARSRNRAKSTALPPSLPISGSATAGGNGRADIAYGLSDGTLVELLR